MPVRTSCLAWLPVFTRREMQPYSMALVPRISVLDFTPFT